MANTLASILAGAGNDPYAGTPNLAPLINGILMAQNMGSAGGAPNAQQPRVPGLTGGNIGGLAMPQASPIGGMAGPSPATASAMPYAQLLGLIGAG